MAWKKVACSYLRLADMLIREREQKLRLPYKSYTPISNHAFILKVPEMGENEMKIAIPVHQGRLSFHFGHSEEFALFEVDPQKKTIREKRILSPPQDAPGGWPRWLCDNGTDLVIAGAMSMRTLNLFTRDKTEVLLGAPSENVESIVKAYLEGVLNTGNNMCLTRC